MTKKELAVEVNKRLTKEFPKPETPLFHKNAYELLIAVILSTQTLDDTTNKATPALFAKYPTVYDLAKANPNDIDPMIRFINYHRTKSKNLVKTAQILIERFNGNVPRTMDELTELPGVGRKVANVVISEWFVKHPEDRLDGEAKAEPVGFVVDTHVKRVTHRLSLTKNTDPAKVEQDLMKVFPKSDWVDGSLRLIFHGRKTCIARRPKCEICPLRDICPKIGVDPEIKKLADLNT